MFAGTMSARVVLFCDDDAAGRALAWACRARGIDLPLWCSVRPDGRWEPAPDVKVCVCVGEPQSDAGDEGAPLREWIRRGGALICVGEREQVSGNGVCVIARDAGWPGRVVDALIDLLGLTPALLPSYENRLRVLGRELDRRGLRVVRVEERGDGFRIQSDAAADLPALEFGGRELGQLTRQALTARGEPVWERARGHLATDGQERLLRYLGSDLDRRGAARVRIVTLARSLVVSGYESASPYDSPQPFQRLYRPSELRLLQQQGHHSRRAAKGWFSRLMRRFGVTS